MAMSCWSAVSSFISTGSSKHRNHCRHWHWEEHSRLGIISLSTPDYSRANQHSVGVRHLHSSSKTLLTTTFSSDVISFSAIEYNPFLAVISYIVLANLLYLARRAHLRNMGIGQLWNIRTTREEGVSWPLFGGMLFAWQILVAAFPILEPVVRLCGGWCVFFYSYPKAQGGGYILEPLACQQIAANLRAKKQIRLDWHAFKYNVGPIGRDGYRHPPSQKRNLPHIDIPRYQLKHWPWKRRHGDGIPSPSTPTSNGVGKL